MRPNRDDDTPNPLLRRADQVVVGTALGVALAAMAAYWLLYGGHRGELIEIDRAAPRDPQFIVDLNQADWPELTVLPDVGEVLAKRIVASREAIRPFRDHADLMRVNGVGPRTLERITPYLLPMPDQKTIVADPATNENES